MPIIFRILLKPLSGLRLKGLDRCSKIKTLAQLISVIPLFPYRNVFSYCKKLFAQCVWVGLCVIPLHALYAIIVYYSFIPYHYFFYTHSIFIHSLPLTYTFTHFFTLIVYFDTYFHFDTLTCIFNLYFVS
jgi:hypothetical protein